MGISSGPMTPLKSGQVCKKWSSWHTDCYGKRWAIFIFPLKRIQRGDHWTNFSAILCWMNPYHFGIIYLFITPPLHNVIIQPHCIYILVYQLVLFVIPAILIFSSDLVHCFGYCHTCLQLGKFSSAWNLAILQVWPQTFFAFSTQNYFEPKDFLDTKYLNKNKHIRA